MDTRIIPILILQYLISNFLKFSYISKLKRISTVVQLFSVYKYNYNINLISNIQLENLNIIYLIKYVKVHKVQI